MTDQPEVIVEGGDRRKRIRTGIAAGVIAGAIAAAMSIFTSMGGATAQTATPTPSTAPGDAKPFGGSRHGPGRGGLGMGIHGEFVTRAPDGGYQTIATQKGEVTSASATSITVKSEDGFSRTYRVDDNTLVNAGNDGIADVKTGDDVNVVAVVSGSTARAVQIMDRTNIQNSRRSWMPPRPNASPSSSSSSG